MMIFRPAKLVGQAQKLRQGITRLRLIPVAVGCQMRPVHHARAQAFADNRRAFVFKDAMR